MKIKLIHISFLLLVILFTKNTFATIAYQSIAEKAYADKKYQDAINAYETILKSNLKSYQLYYNLGNAYYKNNQLGKAIYNYELANKLAPNNDDIKTNLRIANSKKIDDIESTENFFLSAVKSGLTNTFTTTAWAWISIISLLAALLLAFVFFISRQPVFKRIGFFTGSLSLLIFITSFTFGYIALNNKHQTKFAIVTFRESKIYAEPIAIASSKFSLHEGTKVKVLETKPDWTNIKLENGNEGWIKTDQIGLF